MLSANFGLVLQIQITFERIIIFYNGFLFPDCASILFNKKIKKTLKVIRDGPLGIMLMSFFQKIKIYEEMLRKVLEWSKNPLERFIKTRKTKFFE